jgi:acetylornithine/N-succinyldiaminopimelate aminotransferase
MKLFDVYPLMNVTPVKASGCTVTASDGREYLDLYGGHAVISVGHSHPHYIKSLEDQLRRIGFYSNAVINPLQEELAARMGEISGYPDYNLFLCNSGAEANENALKLASFHTGRKNIVAFQGSFHGRTSAAVAATDDEKINAPINKQHDVTILPLNDFEAAALSINDNVAAVIIEGIQGVAGVAEPANDFLEHLGNLCNKHGVVLILDEVQSGCGRTGKYFAHRYSGIQPDIITTAKGIGNGFPVGAVLIAPHIKAKHGMLGTTFGGNYLACVSALAVIDIIEIESLMNNAGIIGNFLKRKLATFPGITKVSGTGLMLGVHFDQPAAAFRKTLLNEHGIFTGSASDVNVVRLLPPLCLSADQAEKCINAFSSVTKPQHA